MFLSFHMSCWVDVNKMLDIFDIYCIVDFPVFILSYIQKFLWYIVCVVECLEMTKVSEYERCWYCVGRSCNYLSHGGVIRKCICWWGWGGWGKWWGYIYIYIFIILNQCVFMIKSNMGLCLQMYCLFADFYYIWFCTFSLKFNTKYLYATLGQ
jgi:hypothetical protein